MAGRIRQIAQIFKAKTVPRGRKGRAELGFWIFKKLKEGRLTHAHYAYFFTTHFGLSPDFYRGKKILDVGCGPRGSLEWATDAAERIGVDPLAEAYLTLGADQHAMQYVAAPSEALPFPNGHFDVVTCFNALDHVEDVDQTLQEIQRVLALGGHFLLLVDVGHAPTITEPITLDWDLVEAFDTWEMQTIQHFEQSVPRAMYESLRRAVPYDHENPTPRYGILSAHWMKPPQSAQ